MKRRLFVELNCSKKLNIGSSKMAKRIKIGDVIQILTSEGVAYAQVTHKNPKYSFLLQVFSGFYPKTPNDFSEVVSEPPQFCAFFPIQTAVNKGLLSVVANVPVADRNKPFPIFRTRNGGHGGSCWLWDGKESKMLDREFTEQELKYSDLGIISAPLLVERIEKGYRPETHDV